VLFLKRRIATLAHLSPLHDRLDEPENSVIRVSIELRDAVAEAMVPMVPVRIFVHDGLCAGAARRLTARKRVVNCIHSIFHGRPDLLPSPSTAAAKRRREAYAGSRGHTAGHAMLVNRAARQMRIAVGAQVPLREFLTAAPCP
jgi:hypothetical protein